MAIIMGKGCLEAIYGLMGWKGLTFDRVTWQFLKRDRRHEAYRHGK